MELVYLAPKVPGVARLQANMRGSEVPLDHAVKYWSFAETPHCCAALAPVPGLFHLVPNPLSEINQADGYAVEVEKNKAESSEFLHIPFGITVPTSNVVTLPNPLSKSHSYIFKYGTADDMAKTLVLKALSKQRTVLVASAGLVYASPHPTPDVNLRA